MPVAKLTKRFIDDLEARGVREFWYDTDIKGLGLKIEPSGAMTWIVEYRPGSGGRKASKKRLTLGKTGVLTPEEARQRAKAVLAKVQSGEDPATEKAERRQAKTVADLCDEYFAAAQRGEIVTRRGTSKKASTLTSDRSRIERHVKPLLGKKLARDVTQNDIKRFLVDVAGGKHAVAKEAKGGGQGGTKGGKGAATRTVRMLGGIFSYAIQTGIRADNPTHGVRKFADRRGERFLSKEELARLGKALALAETIGLPWSTNADAPGAKHLPKDEAARRNIIDPHAAAAVRLLILTGCRLGEILGLKWSQVDLERGLIYLPDSKTGAKTLVLGAPALEVLASLHRIEGCEHVIAGARPGQPRADLKRPWMVLKRAAKLDGVRLHDLRHTYASFGAAAGMGLTIVGRLLGHADVKTTDRYSHFDADPLRRAANSIGGTLQAALDGSPSIVVDLAKSHRR